MGLWWVVLLPRRKTEGFYFRLRAFIAASPKNGGLLRAFIAASPKNGGLLRAFIAASPKNGGLLCQTVGLTFVLEAKDLIVVFGFASGGCRRLSSFRTKKLADLFFPCWCPVGLWWVSCLVSCCLAEKLRGMFQAFVFVLTFVLETSYILRVLYNCISVTSLILRVQYVCGFS